MVTETSEVCLFVKDNDKNVRDYEPTIRAYRELLQSQGISRSVEVSWSNIIIIIGFIFLPLTRNWLGPLVKFSIGPMSQLNLIMGLNFVCVWNVVGTLIAMAP